jgi:multiple antibiotic resistance protein
VLYARVFVTLLVIMDPIGNVPVFLVVTAGESSSRRARAALYASLTAASIILAFAAFGGVLLDALGISLDALQVSGGLLLVLVALELLHPAPDEQSPRWSSSNVALVPLGTPLLAGPGAIAATMFYMRDARDFAGVAIVVGALLTVFVVVYLALRLAPLIGRVLGPNGIALLGRIVGLLLAAIAVQLVAAGIADWVEHGV